MSDELYDVRVIKHHIRRGVATRDDYQKRLDELPDDAEHGQPTETRFDNSFELRQGKGEGDDQ